MRKGAIIIWLFILFAGIISLFWRNEWVYALPTPIPINYKNVSQGEKIDFEGKVAIKDKPVFLHFFNPDCPCSRFNMKHFKSLVKQYGNQINFQVIVMSAAQEYTIEEIKEKFELDIPVLFDTTIAKICGVYSTPQAVIILEDSLLYYRGNYNKSRYCTDKETNYAQIALEAILTKNIKPVFNQFALKAYGCELPVCTK